MNKANRGKISYTLQALNIIPLLFFGVIILLLGTHWFTRAMQREVETELSNVSSNIVVMYDALYPGNYHLEGSSAYQLYKGESNLTNDYALLDRIKADTGLDITLFYQDTRVLTTITGADGNRIVGTGAPETIVRDVLETGDARFYSQTLIYGKSYFSYYAPLFNDDNSVAGILFVGKPSAEVDAAVQSSVRPLMVADILLIVVVSLSTFFYTRAFASSLLQIHVFLSEVSAGNLNARLAPSVLHRHDEIGETALSALNMQRSLRKLIELDTLTALPNRRTGDKRLRQLVADSFSRGIPFCVAIGDIDFFKKVNDTYGHECGDIVLREIADRLKFHMRGRGFAARWGGEEFLLVFENTGLDEAFALSEKLLADIRSTETSYDENLIRVTMTMGLTEGTTDDVTKLLHIADLKLYQGKNSGRDRVIT